MKRILTLILSLGLASVVVAQSPPRKRGRKKRIEWQRQKGRRGDVAERRASESRTQPKVATPNAGEAITGNGTRGRNENGQRNRRGGRNRDRTDRNVRNAASILNAVL